MAFFPIYHYRRHDNPLDRFFGDQLDFFDPWYDLDTSPTTLVIVPSNFRWVQQPTQQGNPARWARNAPHSEKFRVQLNVAGFKPETIKTKVEGRKVIVEAKEEDRQADGDYHIQELRKSYELPEHADANRLASCVTPQHMFVIEVPIQNPEAERRLVESKSENQNLSQFGQQRDSSFDYNRFSTSSNFSPKIVDKGENQKQLEMSLEMKNYKPDEIKVSVKNNELIVKGDHQHKDENRSERVFFFKSTALPPGTQTEQIQSYFTEDGQLKIEAPYVEQKEETNEPAEEQNKETHQ